MCHVRERAGGCWPPSPIQPSAFSANVLVCQCSIHLHLCAMCYEQKRVVPARTSYVRPAMACQHHNIIAHHL
eukprot:scaffold9484_cov124-Isochrysis_galbana.AAC.14